MPAAAAAGGFNPPLRVASAGAPSCAALLPENRDNLQADDFDVDAKVGDAAGKRLFIPLRLILIRFELSLCLAQGPDRKNWIHDAGVGRVSRPCCGGPFGLPPKMGNG